jgi:trehalose-6-phosphate synthase
MLEITQARRVMHAYLEELQKDTTISSNEKFMGEFLPLLYLGSHIKLKEAELIDLMLEAGIYIDSQVIDSMNLVAGGKILEISDQYYIDSKAEAYIAGQSGFFTDGYKEMLLKGIDYLAQEFII